ncbi:MAG: hypothetical protein NZ694_03510 [Tepidimonas sp.]|nr:hypothetical protein [Tepidimonas sp.]
MGQPSHDHRAAATPLTAAPSKPAQATATHPWLAANEAVAEFPRGHLDLLRWERAQGLDTAAAPPPPAAPWTLHDVARLTLQAHPELRASVGSSARELALQQRRATEAVLQAQQAWLGAIAARAVADSWRQTVEATELALELAQRMQQAGNWNAERLRRLTLPHWEAWARLRQAEQAADAALVRLWQRLGHDASPAGLLDHLPRQLPPRPARALAEGPSPDEREQARTRHPDWASRQAEWQRARAALPDHAWQQLQAQWQAAVRQSVPAGPQPDPITGRWPHTWVQALHAEAALQALQRQREGDLMLAWQALHQAHRHAQQLQERVVPVLRQLQEDTQLRYNGMLASPWELLEAVTTVQQGERALLAAELQAWLAELALQGVLAGLPYVPPTDSSVEAAMPSSSPPPGH